MLYRKNITRPESLLRVVGGVALIAAGLWRMSASPLGLALAASGAGCLGHGQHPERGVRLLPRMRLGGSQAGRVSGAP